MKRTLIHLTEEQHENLRQIAFDTKLTMSDHIRRAVDAYLETLKGEEKMEKLMLNEKVKNELKIWIKDFAEINSDYYDFKVIMPNGKTITIMQHVPRHCSPEGDYEPAWGPNMEGIRANISDLETLQGDFFSDVEEEELENYAWKFALSLVKHTTSCFSPQYGEFLEYGTYTDCTRVEFEEALDYVFSAPDCQREEKDEPSFFYIVIDTTI